MADRGNGGRDKIVQGLLTLITILLSVIVFFAQDVYHKVNNFAERIPAIEATQKSTLDRLAEQAADLKRIRELQEAQAQPRRR